MYTLGAGPHDGTAPFGVGLTGFSGRCRAASMAEVRIAPIPERPALEHVGSDGRCTVVVADLHLGLGTPTGAGGGPPETLARAMALDLRGLLDERRAGGVLVVGDVKHPIVGTPPLLRPVVFDFFSTVLAAGYSAEVVLGNHDVGLARWLPKEVVVHPASGLVRDQVGFFHGHRWPTNRVLRAPTIVMGHLHPGIRFAPTVEAPAPKQRCWIRTELPPPPVQHRRPRHLLRAREVIVLPAFNPVAGTESLNRDKPARGRSFLVARFLAPGRPRAYLLDGTDVGEILMPRRVRRSRARPGAAPDP